MREKLINLRKGHGPYSTTIAIPAPIARILIEQGADRFKFEFIDGKLIYTPIVVETKVIKI